MAASSPFGGGGEDLLEPEEGFWPDWKSLETLLRDEVDFEGDWLLWTLLEL